MVCFLLGGFYALISTFYYSTLVVLSTNLVVLFIVIKNSGLYAFYWVPLVNEYFLLSYKCVEYYEDILLILRRIYTTSSIEVSTMDRLYTIEHQVVSHNRSILLFTPKKGLPSTKE